MDRHYIIVLIVMKRNLMSLDNNNVALKEIIYG